MTMIPLSDEPDGAPRIATLDILRGIAILGILFMNINAMGATLAGSHSPLPDLIGWSPADRLAWFLRQLFASGTARCLLQMLFGAGMVILTDRLAAGGAGWGALRRYYWRNVVLFGFGLVHVWLLLWPGDVLHIYALSALIAFPLRRLPARWLIVLGLSFALYSTIMSAIPLHNAIRENEGVAAAQAARAGGRPITAEQTSAIEGLEKWHAQVARMRKAARDETVERRRGYAGWAQTMRADWLHRYRNWRTPLNMYWESIAAILLGAALFKLGILQGRRDGRFYARMAAGWYAIGLSIRGVGAYFTARIDDTVTYAWALDEVGRITTTLGHVGLICWLLGTMRGEKVLQPFAAAGRTALSLYILQTLICLWVLYPPWGLALFGHQGWAALMLTAVAIDAGLLWLANAYVRRWTIAPVEWAWRSIAAGRRLPFAAVTRPAAKDPLPA